MGPGYTMYRVKGPLTGTKKPRVLQPVGGDRDGPEGQDGTSASTGPAFLSEMLGNPSLSFSDWQKFL